LTATSKRPNRGDGRVDQHAHVLVVADVGLDELGLRAERAQLINERFAGLVTAAGGDHLRALLGKRNRCGPANTSECSGDQYDGFIHLVQLLVCYDLLRMEASHSRSI